MTPFPENAIEFQERFGTDEQCEAALMQMRWPKGFICPNCSHDDGYRLTDRRLIQCAVCHHQTSVTAGTIFHKTHLPLTCWFWIIYHVAVDKGGASATRLSSQLKRPYKTIWYVLQKIRHAMGRRDSSISLAGLIELDEAILGPEARRPAGNDDEPTAEPGAKKPRKKKPFGRKPKEGKKRKTVTEVLIMVEAERFHAGNVTMNAVEGLSFKSIQEIVRANVDGDQWFRSDAHHSHWGLRLCSEQFSITKSKEAVGPAALPVVHRVINLLKHFLMGTYFGVSVKYLPGYLNEFCFRFIRRENEERLPESLLRACLFALPMTYAELKL
jgi:Transposase zinc-ribbon domain/ISXO2-like transposase domain